MKKLIRIIVLWIIILILFKLYNQKNDIVEYNTLPNNEDITEVLEINIIDKYNNMSKIYEDPKTELYYEVDMVINGIYYYNVGIRTKGTTIFYWLEDNDSNKLSFKVRLNYKNPEQNYMGMTELHLNAQAMDPTGMREYLIYDIYNEAGIDTQKYCLAELKIDNRSIGLVTMVEVINEKYVEYIYNSKDGNLYKPVNQEYKNVYGAEFAYTTDNIEDYKGIFNYVKTENTTEEDKQRLISILKKMKEATTPEEVESCFMDFDKVLKAMAINKVVSNVDGFAGRTLRNFFIYEENGKIDIIPFDFNFSLGTHVKEYFFEDEDIYDLGLIEYNYNAHSYLVDIIQENEEFLERYNNYIKEIQDLMQEMKLDEKIDILDRQVEHIIQNDTEKFYTYEEYKNGLASLKEFIKQRCEQEQNIIDYTEIN